MTTATKKNPGGCGGNCGCREKACEACPTGDYVRPKFFAGQLLTEEDLELLNRYVVEKNRLHNRHFWGDGVVCGLAVTDNPCQPREVTVEPGYALDCCGNDIVVPCPHTLDIRAMIAELRLKIGRDCTDPCAEPRPAPAPLPTPPAPTVTGRTPGTPATHDPAPLAEKVIERYCLYVRYCESEGDPVLPYSTGDSCGGSCEASRIREGFSFEIRCEKKHTARSPLIERWCECLTNSLDDRRKAALNYIGAQSDRLYAAREYIETRTAPAFDAAAYAPAVERLSVVSKGTTPFTIDEAQAVRQDLAAIVSGIAASYYLSEVDRKKGTETLKNMRAVARSLNQVLEEREFSKVIADLPEIERIETEAFLEEMPKLAETLSASVLASDEFRLLAAGIPSTPQYQAALAEAVRDGQKAVSQSYAQSATWQPRGPIYGAIQVYEKRTRMARECACDALLPPCPPCDDPAVLLACISYENCEVSEICNIERRFVMTPVNLRYWFPFEGLLGEAIEGLCCPREQDRKNNSLSTLARLYAAFLLRDCDALENEKSAGGKAVPQDLQSIGTFISASRIAPAAPQKDFDSAVVAALERSGVLAVIEQRIADRLKKK